MRLLNYLLGTGKLERDRVEFYLAYTTLIFELGDKYEWRDVLNFDFQYRERQAELGFDWGSMVSVMELQLLAGKNRNSVPFDPKAKWNPKPKPKSDICRNFANSGECVYGASCKFKHISVDRRGNPRGPGQANQQPQSAGLLQHPPANQFRQPYQAAN